MKFSEYAHKWLYGQNGYYTKLGQIGREGDFYTSVSASRMFGGCIANHLVRRIESGAMAQDATVCEIGAHAGFLIEDIASFVYSLAPHLLTSLKFVVVEPLHAVAKAQEARLAPLFESVADIKFVDDISSVKGECGFVVANELFDAFAFELIFDGRMAYMQGHELIWAAADNDVLAAAQENGIEKGEVALGFESFAKKLFSAFDRMEFVTFDYGQEYARNDFSARVYAKHQTTPLFEAELKEHFEKSDLTCDVHFGHLNRAFESEGFRRLEYSTQMSALVNFGLADLLQKLSGLVPPQIYAQEAARAKTLIDPAFLGERFKMIRFSKGEM